jgi:hypothetical protein
MPSPNRSLATKEEVANKPAGHEPVPNEIPIPEPASHVPQTNEPVFTEPAVNESAVSQTAANEPETNEENTIRIVSKYSPASNYGLIILRMIMIRIPLSVVIRGF